MAGGPAGREVGQVTVRVAPNTSKFDNELRRQLKGKEKELSVNIPVDFDVDEDGLRRKIEGIRVPEIAVPVGIDARDAEINVTADTSAARGEVDTFIARTKTRRTSLKVSADIDEAALEASVARASTAMRDVKIKGQIDIDKQRFFIAIGKLRPPKIKAQVDVDQSLASVAFSSLGQNLRASVGGALDGIGSLFSKVRDLGVGAGENIASSFKGVGSALSTVIGAGLQFAKFSAIAAGLAVAGAAVSAAWGLVSTAIAAVPAAIGFIGAPIAAVALGLDGIKRAAKTLEPEFNKLKESVSATFEKGLLPVMKQLRPIFPQLTAGVNKIATSLVGVGQGLADFITKGQGLKIVETLMNNVSTAIKNSQPGIISLTSAFLKLAGNQAALSVLTTVVNEMGAALQRIADNPALNTAFKGLEGVLASVTRGFGDLVNNGIKLFASAAPGIQKGLDSITNFFNRFDWNALGQSVGGVFEGLGQALDKVPTSTIKAIETSFAHLSETFKSAQFQAQLTNMVNAVPAAIRELDRMVQAFGRIGEGVAKAIIALDKIDARFESSKQKISSWVDDVGNKMLGDNFRKGIGDAAGKVDGALNQFFGITESSLKEGMVTATQVTNQGGQAIFDALTLHLSNLAPAVTTAFVGFGEAVRAPMQSLPAIVSTALNPLGAIIDGSLGKIAPKVSASLAPVPPAVQSELGKLLPIASTAVNPLAAAILGPINSINLRMPGTAGLIPTSLGSALSPLGQVAAIAGAAVPPSLFNPLNPLPGQVNTLGGQIVVGFGSGIKPLPQSMIDALAPLPTNVQTGLTPAQQAMTTGAGQLVDALGLGMASMGLTVDSAMLGVNTSISGGMLTATSALSTAATGMQTAMTGAMTGVTAAVTAGMTNIQGVVIATGAALTAAMTTAMSGMTAAATSGMAAASAAISAGVAQINATMSSAGAQLTSSMQSAMDQLVNAVRAGVQQAQAAIAPLPGQMAAVVSGGAGQMQSAGSALMEGMRAGIMAKAGEIAAAAAAVVHQAIAAARAAAAVASPSRVFMEIGGFMGEGMEIGLLGMRDAVGKAGDKLANAAVSAADQVKDAFELTDPVSDFITRLQAGTRQALSAGMMLPGPLEALGKQTTINVYNPRAEKASDSLSRRARTLSALGAFG